MTTEWSHQQPNDQRASAFFGRLSSAFSPPDRVDLVVVAHMVSTAYHFFPALERIGKIKLLLPKPNTANDAVFESMKQRYPHAPLSRDWARDARKVLKTFDTAGIDDRFVIVDIGGYFASVAGALRQALGDRFWGIMEGTENGVTKYREAQPYSCPVYTVADSRLKYPENHLVGTAVVHSIESVIRETDDVIQNRRACVIGFGKVGVSVAENLRARGVPVCVVDKKPVPMAEAAARGFRVYRNLTSALVHSNLVVGATGAGSLNREAFERLNKGTMVATVTSADDEFAEGSLATGWATERMMTERGTPITRYSNSATNFYILNDGHTINFLHGAVLGPAIQLIEGEKIAALFELISGDHSPGLHRVSSLNRDRVADLWLDHFLREIS